jgi:hypothetical protein
MALKADPKPPPLRHRRYACLLTVDEPGEDCCSARRRTLVVAVERIARRSVMKSETSSRETSAATVTADSP